MVVKIITRKELLAIDRFLYEQNLQWLLGFKDRVSWRSYTVMTFKLNIAKKEGDTPLCQSYTNDPNIKVNDQ